MAEYIEREEIMNRLFTEYATDSKADVFELIRSIPTVDVQPIRHGRWIAENQDNRGYADCYTCTNCKNYVYTYTLMRSCEYDYCPYCGAKIDDVCDT